MVDFTILDGNQEPASYDVKIDAKSLISNERIPAGIQTTIEKVLNSSKDIGSIDFFGKSNETEESQSGYMMIREVVRNVYRISLYIFSIYGCGYCYFWNFTRLWFFTFF